MAHYLLLSILFATLFIPIRAATSKGARAGLRKATVGMAVFLFLWVGFCAYLFLRMGGGS